MDVYFEYAKGSTYKYDLSKEKCGTIEKSNKNKLLNIETF